MSASIPFRVGDAVVYPNHGVGVIEQIGRREIGATSQEFYHLRIEASNLRVMVPFATAASVGMRPVIEPRALAPILLFLQGRETVACAGDWKGRFKENSDKLRGGELAQVAEVLKGLVQVHQAKPLSFREKKMLDRAAYLVVSEIASASQLSLEEALALLQRTLAQASLVLPPFENDGLRQAG